MDISLADSRHSRKSIENIGKVRANFPTIVSFWISPAADSVYYLWLSRRAFGDAARLPNLKSAACAQISG
jgi:hypothetical protein